MISNDKASMWGLDRNDVMTWVYHVEMIDVQSVCDRFIIYDKE